MGGGVEVLYSVSYDDTVKVWAVECGDWYCAARLGMCDDRNGAPRGAASADGGGGAVGDEGGGAAGESHTSTVWSLAPSRVRLFSGSDGRYLGVWKMHTAAERNQCFIHLKTLKVDTFTTL